MSGLGSGPDEAELRESGNAVVQSEFLDELAVLQAQHGGPGEVHLAAADSTGRCNTLTTA